MAIEQTIAAEVLESTAPGASGASYIGIESIPGISATEMQTALEVTKQLIDAKIGTIKDNDSILPSRPVLKITGEGRTLSDDVPGNQTVLHIPGLEDYPHVERVTLEGAEQGTYRILNLSGNIEVTPDADNNRYDVNIPFAEGVEPADEITQGRVRLTQPAEDPLDPVVPGDNDPRLEDPRDPNPHEHAGEEITSGTVDVTYIGTGTKDENTFYNGLGEFVAPPGASPEGPVSINSLPIADDGEANVNEIVRSTDFRLSNTRSPAAGSVDLPSAAPEISLVYICSSADRPTSPKRGQLIYETDTGLVMKNTGTPSTPNWQSVGSAGVPITLQDEGSSVAQRDTLNIQGAGASIADDDVNEKSILSIPGTLFQSSGSDVAAWAKLNVIGATVANDTVNQRVNLTIPGAGTHASPSTEGVTYLSVPALSSTNPIALAENDPRVLDGVYNVVRFGATGDGSTDDTVAIQNAINAAGSGIVWFPPGNYKVTTQGITGAAIMGGSARLVGTHPSLVRISMASATGNTLQFGVGGGTQSVFAGVQGIAFRPVVARTAGDGNNEISAPNFAFLTIDDVWFDGTTGMHRPMRIGGATSQSIVAKISRIRATWFNELVRFVNTYDVFMHSCSTSGQRATSGAVWVDGGCDSLNITNCDFANSNAGRGTAPGDKTGITIRYATDLFASVPSRFGQITACYFDSHNTALRIDDARHITFTNCWFGAIPGIGAYLPGGHGIKFVGCIFANCGQHGAHVTSGATRVSFIGCTAVSNNQDTSNTINTFHGFFFGPNSTSFKVESCDAYNDSTTFSSRQGYGAYLSTGCDGYVLTGNDFRGNGVAGIHNPGTNSTTKQVANNLGTTD